MFKWSASYLQHTQIHCFTHHGLFELIGFNAAHKERLTHAQRPHEQLEWALKLTAQSRGTLPCLHSLKTQKLSHLHHAKINSTHKRGPHTKTHITQNYNKYPYYKHHKDTSSPFCVALFWSNLFLSFLPLINVMFSYSLPLSPHFFGIFIGCLYPSLSISLLLLFHTLYMQML